MPTLREAKKNSKLHMIQYGPTGIGKTMRATQALRWGPVYIFDLDCKADALQLTFDKDNDALDNIEFDSYPDSVDVPVAAESVFRKLDEFEAMAAEGKFKYATIVLDSFTAWQNAMLRWIVYSNPKASRAQMTSNLGKPGSVTNTKIVFPDLVDYRAHAPAQTEFVMRLMRLPANIILNFHEESKVDEGTGVVKRGLFASGAIEKSLPSFFNEVHRLIRKDGKIMTQIQHDGQFPANSKLTGVKGPYAEVPLSMFDGIALKRK